MKRWMMLLAAMLLCLWLLPAGAMAETYTYLEGSWDSAAGTVTYTEKTVPNNRELITPNDSYVSYIWDSDWIVIEGNVSIYDRIRVLHSTKLVLLDGATLTATNGIAVGRGCSLTIYAQSTGESAGKLVANSFDGKINDTTFYGVAIGGETCSTSSCPTRGLGTIIIHGGVIEATGYGERAAIGGCNDVRDYGVITIYGGKVQATQMPDKGTGYSAAM